jgi:hypothetical protein
VASIKWIVGEYVEYIESANELGKKSLKYFPRSLCKFNY